MQESAFNTAADANQSERRQFLRSSAGLPHWEPYTTDARTTMFLDNQSTLLNDPESQIRKLWADLKFEKPLNGDSPTTRESPRART